MLTGELELLVATEKALLLVGLLTSAAGRGGGFLSALAMAADGVSGAPSITAGDWIFPLLSAVARASAREINVS